MTPPKNVKFLVKGYTDSVEGSVVVYNGGPSFGDDYAYEIIHSKYKGRPYLWLSPDVLVPIPEELQNEDVEVIKLWASL